MFCIIAPKPFESKDYGSMRRTYFWVTLLIYVIVGKLVFMPASRDSDQKPLARSNNQNVFRVPVPSVVDRWNFFRQGIVCDVDLQNTN